MSSDMSKQDTVRAPNGYLAHSPAPGRGGTPSHAAAPSRARFPVPPSPLSRMQDDSSSSSPRHASHGQSAQPARPGRGGVEASCFIHSGLDKHGALQEWARRNDHASPHSHQQMTPIQPIGTHHGSPSATTRSDGQQAALSVGPMATPKAKSAPTSSATSPIFRDSLSGYESDKSSKLEGSAILDGDLMDDEEAARSLSRQLAETAQGVREMSKELGRTRVRSKIQHVLIVTKARDNRLIKLTRELALYLMLKAPSTASTSSQTSAESSRSSRERGMVVYVDAQLRTSKRFDAAGIQNDYPHLFEPVMRRRSSSSASVGNLSAYPSAVSVSEAGRKPRDQGQLRYWTGEMCSNSPQLFDFVITLGGDGTVLFTSWLFQRIVPPVLPFALGSLGFLTNFDFAQYRQTMDKVVDEGIRVNLRMRFTCTVYRAIAPEEAAAKMAKGKKRKAIKRPGGEILINQVDKEGWEALEGQAQGQPCTVLDGKKDKEIMCFSTRPVEQFEVLNDLVVDRGPSPFVSLLEVFGDEHHLTTVQADGLTVSTPTGSTAYSLSAGGSLVHPQIPALLLTPICPHTLSFRPMLLPDSMELRVCVPYNSRSTAWASFDGRGRVELKQGDHIKIAASKYPFPTVCADQQSTDWFQSISRTLRWNEREKQKSFVVVEEENEPAASKAQSKKQAEERDKQPTVHEVESEDKDDEDEDEDEEDFDIDDKSGGATPSSPRANAAEPVAPKALASLLATHKSGVDSPDRFVTPYEAPPPLSQRHLLEALASATTSESEIKSRDNEMGQRDHIRADTGELRVGDGAHRIPAGRGESLAAAAAARAGAADDAVEMHTPKPSTRHGKQVRHALDTHERVAHAPHGHRRQQSAHGPPGAKRDGPKSKAFAFFGDDSASDFSDTPSD